jgi:hypothetical protein
VQQVVLLEPSLFPLVRLERQGLELGLVRGL